MTIEQRVEEPADQFPVGMRVLAVDDDPTCLLLLERLLRRCKYHVTTRTHAIAALNLLRENKNRFDLVISDVHMPDMDGFKLLELVGLEMDLPVIMLSANSDPKLVMKGMTHGACNYLLKPVRIEELQIIWQHVIRKKKVDPKISENGHNGSSEGGQGAVGNGIGDQKFNKKRKDQVEGEDEDHDENGTDNDDPSAQKKPRIVWSVELHRKFLAAVKHLGNDKAVPKRILELMNVEKLTRENVASHLQKYRLYLRKISCVNSQQSNMVAAFGNADSTSYIRISSLNGMGGFTTLSGSPRFQNASFNSFQPNAMLGRLNSSASLGIQRLPSPVQVNHSQFSGFTGDASDHGTTTIIPGNPRGRILKGMPISFEFDQPQDNNGRHMSEVGEVIPKVTELSGFPISSGLPDARSSVRSSNSSHLTDSNNSMTFQGHSVRASSQLGIQNQLSGVLHSHFSDRAQGNDRWPIAVQSSAVQTNSYAPYHGSQHIDTHLDDGSSIVEMPLSVADYQYQATHPSVDEDHAPYGQDIISIRRMTNAAEMSEFNSVEHPDCTDREVEHTISMPNSKRGYQLGHGKSTVYQLPNTVGSLEELVSSMMK